MTEENKRDFDEKVSSVLLKEKDIAEALKKEGRELTDEEIEFISGGAKWTNFKCPSCGSVDTLFRPRTSKYRCSKCGFEW